MSASNFSAAPFLLVYSREAEGRSDGGNGKDRRMGGIGEEERLVNECKGHFQS